MRIVLVEDQESLRKGIAYRLRDLGHAVDTLGDGDSAADFLRQEDVDLVILDINLPGQSGLDVLRDMRARGDPRPVILLTARVSTEDRVRGLDLGADDYLVKPFAMDELVARVRALARRRDIAPRTAIDLGPLRLELTPLRLLGPEGEIDVPRRELVLLEALAEGPGGPVSKASLLARLYGTGSESGEKAVEVYASRLRRRLAPFGLRIGVRRGIGYRLETDPQ